MLKTAQGPRWRQHGHVESIAPVTLLRTVAVRSLPDRMPRMKDVAQRQ